MKFLHKLASVALAGTLAFSLSAGTALAAGNTNEVKKLPWLENNGHDLSKEEPPADGNYWVFRGDSEGLTKSTIYVTNRQNGGEATYPAAVIKMDKDGKPVVTLANQPAGMRVLYEETDPICDGGGEACFDRTFKTEVKIGGTISPQAKLGDNDFTITIERKDPDPTQTQPNKVEGRMRIVVKSMSDKYEPRLIGNSQGAPLSLKPGASLTDASIKGYIQFQQYAKAGTLKAGKPFDGDSISLPDGAAFTYPKADESKYGVQQIPVTVTYKDKTTDSINVFVKVSAKAPSQTPVDNPKSLTEDEKKAVEAAVKAANKSLPADAKIMVADDGKVTITYADQSTDTVEASVSVRAKTTAEKTDVKAPSQTPVDNPKSLTEDEKKAVEAAVKAANPTLPQDAKIVVATDGKVTITYADQSKDTLSADEVVRAKTTAEKTKAAQPEVKMLSNTGTHVGAILIIAVSLIGIGAFAIVRRRNDA